MRRLRRRSTSTLVRVIRESYDKLWENLTR